MTHELKIEENYLRNLMSGTKMSEIRFNDRDYQLGDDLEFWDSENSNSVHFRITHIHSGIGMQDGYVVLSVNHILKEQDK